MASVGLIVGKIAVRRRLGFLAGALGGAIFYLIIFFVSLISSYPGNLVVNTATMTIGSLVIPFLLLCLWTLGGGLVSLFGTWVMTVRHPHYVNH
jgi:H+/Cl- antiporter ClcA